MSVDLKRLPEDEEFVRLLGASSSVNAGSIQNVLDALNFYRCRAAFLAEEFDRVMAELTKVGDWKKRHRIFGGSYGRS